MSLCKPADLPNNRIAFRIGFDGHEPEFLVKHFTAYLTSALARVTVTIDTYHPEINGANYFNRALLALVQEALLEIGLAVVEGEYYQEEGVVPVELPGTLELEQEYLLVALSLARVGSVRLWSYQSVGGGGPFYGDDTIVVDMVFDEHLVAAFQQALAEHCAAAKVELENVETVSLTPLPVSNGVERLLNFFR